MKRMPLIVLLLLILLVVISGVSKPGDMQQYSDGRQEHEGLLLPPPFDMRESPEEKRMFFFMYSSASEDRRSFLEDNIEKSETVVERLNNVIRRLKEEGNDVRELEQMVYDYDVLVSEARKYFEMAENSSSDSGRQKYLELSRERIIDANSRLKPIMDGIKTYLPGPIQISNNTLVAQGSGIAILSGSFDISLSLSEGKFSVVDFADDVVIGNEYEYERGSVPHRVPVSDMLSHHDIISYVDVNGNVSMSGSSFSVAIMADRIEIVAKGTGEVELVGKGTYNSDRVPSQDAQNVWIAPIFEVE